MTSTAPADVTSTEAVARTGAKLVHLVSTTTAYLLSGRRTFTSASTLCGKASRGMRSAYTPATCAACEQVAEHIRQQDADDAVADAAEGAQHDADLERLVGPGAADDDEAPAPRFSVGDRVRDLPADRTGVVVSVTLYGAEGYGVRVVWDGGDGAARQYSEDYLEPVEDAPAADDVAALDELANRIAEQRDATTPVGRDRDGHAVLVGEHVKLVAYGLGQARKRDGGRVGVVLPTSTATTAHVQLEATPFWPAEAVRAPWSVWVALAADPGERPVELGYAATLETEALEAERRRGGHPGPARRTTSVRFTEAQYAAIDVLVAAGYGDGVNAVLARLVEEAALTAGGAR